MPLILFPATKDSTLLHHRNCTLQWNQRSNCLCFHKYTKMSMYPHKPESMFYTVYLPTTIRSLLDTAKRHTLMSGNFFYNELLTRSSPLEEMCLWTVTVYSKRELKLLISSIFFTYCLTVLSSVILSTVRSCYFGHNKTHHLLAVTFHREETFLLPQ